MAGMTGMVGMVHPGITVSDLEKSIEFYRDILGLELLKREEKITSRGERLGVPGAIIECAFFAVPGSDATIELIQFHSPPQPNNYGQPINAVGQVHIAFRVSNIEAAMAELRAQGVCFVSHDYVVINKGPLNGWKFIYFKDPDGTNIELIEGDS